MTVKEAKKELERFVKTKTTLRPAFLDVILNALVTKTPKSDEEGENLQTTLSEGGMKVELKKPLSAEEFHQIVMKLKEEVISNGFYKTKKVDDFFEVYWMEILDMLDDALYAYLNNEKLR